MRPAWRSVRRNKPVLMLSAYCQATCVNHADFPSLARENSMSNHAGVEHHHKAAEHHEHAAKHHREAARHHEAGDHEKAAHHAHSAHGHASHAEEHHAEASRHHAEHHG